MQIVDIADIIISSGSGGNGAVAFRREAHVANGGPSGGDGGRGGSIIFEASENLHTLLDFRYQHHFKAGVGQNGGIKNMNGRKGEDLVIPVPVGTVIKDLDQDKVICDLAEAGQRFVAAKGGRGGKGNAHFANAVYQAPRFAQPGQPGLTRKLQLELKSIADIGLVGMPNAGKSSLLSVISAARPKIADYPFTTLRPNLGVISLPNGDGCIVADIPGLIEGASDGIGLGHDFLRHVERTRLLLHLVDGAAPDPIANYRTIQAELKAYPAQLDNKPQVLVINKKDLLDAGDLEILLDLLKEETDAVPLLISTATREGLTEMLYTLEQQLSQLPPLPLFEYEPESEADQQGHIDPVFSIEFDDGVYIVHSDSLERMLALSDLEDSRALHRFQQQLYRQGIIEALKAEGAGSGDTIRIGSLEFDYL